MVYDGVDTPNNNYYNINNPQQQQSFVFFLVCEEKGAGSSPLGQRDLFLPTVQYLGYFLPFYSAQQTNKKKSKQIKGCESKIIIRGGEPRAKS
jgi:hypothetical protein